MKHILLLAFALLTYSLHAQLPPAELEPTAENKALIDSLITVSKFDVYFKEHCTLRIQRVADEKNWSTAEVEKRISRIDISDFMEYTVYNAFASLTAKDLKALIELMGKLNQNDNYVFTHAMIESNLELYIQSRFLK